MSAYRIPRSVAHVVPDGEPDLPNRVFLMQLPDGEPLVLQDSAAWIWLLAADGEDDVPSAISRVIGTEEANVRADVLSFLSELQRRGLLESGASDH